MIEAVRDIPPLPSFLKRTFFGAANRTFLTEEVDMDYKKGKRRMAPFVAPLVGGIPMDREGFETKTFAVPKISPERVVSVANLRKRTMGENVYSTKTPAQRAIELQAQDYTDLDEAIALTEEWMCQQLLFNGKIIVKGEVNSGNPVEFSVDYKFTNKVVLTGSDLWTNGAAKPMEQFVDWRKEIIAASGIDPDIMLMRSETAMTLINHANFLKYFDTLRYNFGTVEPAIREPLLTYFGRLPIVGADLFAYDATYMDPQTKTVTPFIPDNTVLFASSHTRGSMYYGAITYMAAEGSFQTAAVPRLPLVFFDQDSSTRTLRLTSRPLPMPVNVDGWAVRVVA
jgi:hypothetical protein